MLDELGAATEKSFPKSCSSGENSISVRCARRSDDLVVLLQACHAHFDHLVWPSRNAWAL